MCFPVRLSVSVSLLPVSHTPASILAVSKIDWKQSVKHSQSKLDSISCFYDKCRQRMNCAEFAI